MIWCIFMLIALLLVLVGAGGAIVEMVKGGDWIMACLVTGGILAIVAFTGVNIFR